MKREKALKFCNRTIEVSLYALIFYIPISTALIESFAGLAIFAWLLRKFLIHPKQGLLPQSLLNKPILLYLLACFISAVFSSNRQISFTHLIFKSLEYFAIFFVVVDVLDKRILRNIFIVFILSIGLLSLDGIYQYFTHHDFLRGRHQIIEGRINGSFSTPNDFSNYIVTLLPIIASLLFLKFKRAWIRITLFIIMLMAFICLIISTTRSAWIAVLLAIPLFALLKNKKLVIWALVFILIVFSLSCILPPMAKSQIVNFFSAKSWGSVHRQILWSMGARMFLASPLTGQGLGTFMYNFTKFMPGDYPVGDWGISYAHNCFIQIAAETGVLGLGSFLFMVAVLFISSFKILKKMQRKDSYYILSGMIACVFTYMVGSFFDTNLYSLPLAILFWLILGITTKAGSLFSKEA